MANRENNTMNSDLVGAHWWNHPTNLEAVLNWLEDHGQLDASSREQRSAFLREPWKHEAAYQAVRASDPALQRARN